MPVATRPGRTSRGPSRGPFRAQPGQPVSAADRARRFVSNPVVQFLAAGLVTLLVLIVVSGWLSRRAATDEAITDARATTQLLGRSVVETALTRGVVNENAAAVDKFDRQMLKRVLVGDVLRIKIWKRDGTIIYSDKPKLIGRQFELEPTELTIIDKGGTAAAVSDLSKPENRFEQGFGRLLEVYSRVWTPGNQPLLFEAYFSYDDVSRRSAEVLSAFRPITVVGLLIFLALTAPLVYVLARRLDAAAAGRERLLMAAVEASDVERRRIARDLHDGVVQQLAGTSFALSAAARDAGGQPEASAQLEELAGGVRHSLRALRSLLVEIYPPELQTEGLAAAFDDLVAPCVAAGIAVDVHVAEHADVPPEVVALVWRIGQEAVRNAQRHGRPSRLAVVVTRPEGGIRLEVVDDGVGFDASAPPAPGHLGLRGLRDLARDAGGTLQVQSSPGAGTRVTLEVRRP
jgi:two-component system, NarL family, sensor kinase